MKPLSTWFEMPEEPTRPSVGETARMIDDAVRAIQAAEYAEIERAIEMALQGGKHGVRVDRVDGKLISARPDPAVPYGVLHEHLTRPPGLYDDLLRAQAALLARDRYVDGRYYDGT